MFARLERAQSIPSPHFLEVNVKNQRENKGVQKLSEEKTLRKTRFFKFQPWKV